MSSKVIDEAFQYKMMTGLRNIIQRSVVFRSTTSLNILFIFTMCSLKMIAALAFLAMASAEHNYGGYNSYGGSGYGGAHIPIVRYENVNNGDGTYRYNYETGNGISAHESGSPRASGPEGPAVTAEGGFSYRAPDGQQISLTYTADENGFHPTGSHIPTPPPIPEAILRSLQYNAQHPSSGDGQYDGGRYNHGGYRY